MRFTPGQSGNPAGRPLGARNKKTLALEAVFDADAEETVREIIERAKRGEPAAMRLCMERAVPTGRNRPLAIALPPIETPADARAAVAVVMAELADGAITLTEVAALLRLVERLVRMAETIRKMQWPARPDEDAAEAATQSGADDAVAAPHDQASPAGADAAEARSAAGEPLYSPVNDSSIRPREGIAAARDLRADVAVDHGPQAGDVAVLLARRMDGSPDAVESAAVEARAA
jgi:hypothetical protein